MVMHGCRPQSKAKARSWALKHFERDDRAVPHATRATQDAEDLAALEEHVAAQPRSNIWPAQAVQGGS